MAPLVMTEGIISSPISLESIGARSHRAVLQTLDAYFPSKDGPNGVLFYGVDNFKPTENAWNGKQVIFCGVSPPEHFNYQDYLKDPVKTLKKINGRVVGVADWTYVATDGSKRLESDITIFDAEAESLLSNGSLGLSTDFDCSIDGDKLSGVVSPNYILVWDMTVANEQNDMGARFMNTGSKFPVITDKKEEEDTKMVPDPETKSLLTSILDAIKALGNNSMKHANTSPGDISTPTILESVTGVISPAVPVEYLDKMTAIEKEKAEIALKASDLERTVAEMTAAEQKRQEDSKALEIQALETEWQTTIMPKLPKGLLHEEVKAKEVKDLYIADPRGFMRTYGDMFNKPDIEAGTVNVPNTAHGQTHQNTSPNDAMIVPSVGSFNARTGKYE